jgi:hypothetical protein
MFNELKSLDCYEVENYTDAAPADIPTMLRVRTTNSSHE